MLNQNPLSKHDLDHRKTTGDSLGVATTAILVMYVLSNKFTLKHNWNHFDQNQGCMKTTCSWTNCRNSTEWLRCKISISFHESCNIVEKSNVNKLKAPNSWHLAILDMPTPYMCNTSILWFPSVNVTLLLGHHKCSPAGPLGTCHMINLKGAMVKLHVSKAEADHTFLFEPYSICPVQETSSDSRL